MKIAEQKLIELQSVLLHYGSAAVGFSGGADSAFLAAAAYKVLGKKAIALTAYSATLPEREREESVQIAAQIGISHKLLLIDELADDNFTKNTASRCYFCKKTRFSELAHWAEEHGYVWVLEGSNADDVADYRPGMKAVDELTKVVSPLLEVGLTKQEIRELSRKWGLPTWDKPSAACLSSRVAYGETITTEKLGQIERAEELIRGFCPGQVRVRHHGNLARIEVDEAMIEVISRPTVRQTVMRELKKLGFTFVTVDLAGYHTGSMNAALVDKN